MKTYGKVFETEYVEDIDRRRSLAFVDAAVDSIHQPSEERTTYNTSKTIYISLKTKKKNTAVFEKVGLEKRKCII